MRHKGDLRFVGIDLNATRIRALAGTGAGAPRLLPLEGGQADLPLILSLERRHVAIGQAGLGLCRRLPHLICADFLVHLGKPRVWETGWHSLDAADAVAHVFEHLAPAMARAEAAFLAVPAYLTRPQAQQLLQLAEQARWPTAGALATPLAMALAAYQQQPWSGTAVMVDVDDHALTLTLIILDEGRVQILEREVCTHLSLRAWKERLLNAVAERCIRRSRRDPRESSTAEQALYEQLDGVFRVSAQGRLADLTLQSGQWYQDLVLRPEEVLAFCARLARTAQDALRHLLHREIRPAPDALVLTATAGRLPGLSVALQQTFAEPNAPAEGQELSEDFGEHLLPAHRGETALSVLDEDAVARTAFDLAAALQHGQVQRGPFDTAAPLLPVPRTPSVPTRRFGTIA